MMICPDCNGRKQTMAHLNYANRSGEFKMIACHTCKGEGEITEEHARRIEQGERLREKRVAAGISIGELGRSLGIPPQELNRYEHGRAEIPVHIPPLYEQECSREKARR